MSTCGSTDTGTVYFIQCSFTGRIKIGWTSGEAKERYSAIRSCSPTELFLIGSIPGSRDTEAAFHKAFRNSHLRGEWFKPSETVVKLLASVGVEVWPEEVSKPYKRRMRVISAREDEIIEAAREELDDFRAVDGAPPLNL